MVIKQNQFAYNSCLEQINNANEEQLKPFVDKYLSDHSYFKPKDIALEYLFKKHQITMYDQSNYSSLILNLTRKIGRLLAPYKLSGAIQKYNSRTYQVINRNQPRIDRIF